MPVIFLKSKNLNLDLSELKGLKIPENKKGVITDLQFSFTKGNFDLLIDDIPLLTEITSTTNGYGRTRINENQQLIIKPKEKIKKLNVFVTGVLADNFEKESDIEQFIESLEYD